MPWIFLAVDAEAVNLFHWHAILWSVVILKCKKIIAAWQCFKIELLEFFRGK